MKKRVISFVCVLMMVCGLVYNVSTDANATDAKVVDGSYLTQLDESVGQATLKMRGKYLMEGSCSISSAGRGRIYIYGASTANFDVEEIAVVVTVERYHEETDTWGQVYLTDASDVNTDYVSFAQTLEVPRGYYYRVTGVHYAGPSDGVKDVADSFTDGVYVR